MAFPKYSEGHQGSCFRSKLWIWYEWKAQNLRVKHRYNLPGSHDLMMSGLICTLLEAGIFLGRAWEELREAVECSGQYRSCSSPASSAEFCSAASHPEQEHNHSSWKNQPTREVKGERGMFVSAWWCYHWNISKSVPNLLKTEVSTHPMSPQHQKLPPWMFWEGRSTKSIPSADICTITST